MHDGRVPPGDALGHPRRRVLGRAILGGDGEDPQKLVAVRAAQGSAHAEQGVGLRRGLVQRAPVRRRDDHDQVRLALAPVARSGDDRVLKVVVVIGVVIQNVVGSTTTPRRIAKTLDRPRRRVDRRARRATGARRRREDVGASERGGRGERRRGGGVRRAHRERGEDERGGDRRPRARPALEAPIEAAGAPREAARGAATRPAPHPAERRGRGVGDDLEARRGASRK